MAVTFPLADIVTGVSFQDQVFQLMVRQEYSRTAGGVTIGKDLGSALWSASYTTMPLENRDALAYEARLNALDGVVWPFEAGDLRAQLPRAYPGGDFADTGKLASVNANNKAIALKGLTAGHQISVGDYLSFDYGDSRALHQVIEAATANGAGTTPQFEVRPHLRPGWELETEVTLAVPTGLFVLMPGSVQPKAQGGLHTVITFKATQMLL